MALTAEERSRNARRAALIRWSREDPAPQGKIAQAGLLAKFEREVDPDGELDAGERRRRAECARRAFMIEIRAKRGHKATEGAEQGE